MYQTAVMLLNGFATANGRESHTCEETVQCHQLVWGVKARWQGLVLDDLGYRSSIKIKSVGVVDQGSGFLRSSSVTDPTSRDR